MNYPQPEAEKTAKQIYFPTASRNSMQESAEKGGMVLFMDTLKNSPFLHTNLII